MYALYCFWRQLPKVLLYTLIITTYCMNKRILFRTFPSSYFPYFIFHIFPGFLHIFFLVFSLIPAGLEPLTFRIALAYQYLFYTTTLRSSVENYPSKNHFYFTWSLTFVKIYITIYLFICLKHVPRSLFLRQNGSNSTRWQGAECFYCFEVFETPDETLAFVVDMLLTICCYNLLDF